LTAQAICYTHVKLLRHTTRKLSLDVTPAILAQNSTKRCNARRIDKICL